MSLRILLPIFMLVWGGSLASPAIIKQDIFVNVNRFSTWQGIEPDKWATVWLIKRYIAPDAYFIFVPPNTPLTENAFAFDVPGSVVGRAKDESMYSRLKQAMQLNTIELEYIDAIIHDIEVNIWDQAGHPHAIWFEIMYRRLQERYERDKVPIDCYLIFFDKVASLALKKNVSADDYSSELALLTECPGLFEKAKGVIGQMGHLDILRAISLGKKVMFIDTREVEEYNEIHLPNSHVLQLRNVNKQSIKAYLDADLIVPYCVKDFRGFEVAKAMSRLGVQNIVTLSPNGLKGWVQAELPTVRDGAVTESQAQEQLFKCAMEPLKCIKDSM